MHVRDKTDYNANPSRRSLYHIKITKCGVQFWRRGLSFEEMLETVTYLLSDPFSLVFAAKKMISPPIPRITFNKTLFRSNDCAPTSRSMLRPEQTSVKLMQSVL